MVNGWWRFKGSTHSRRVSITVDFQSLAEDPLHVHVVVIVYSILNVMMEGGV